MESHRMSGTPDCKLQRGYVQPGSRGSPICDRTGLFGLRVQVHGIEGHPYVVVNNSDREACPSGGPESLRDQHRDVSLMGHQVEYAYTTVGGSPPGSPSVGRRPPHKQGRYGCSSAEFREIQRTKVASTMFHYRNHPELLRPYDPENNSLNLPLNQTALLPKPGHLNRGLQSGTTQAAVSRARLPLPAEGSAGAQAPAPALGRAPNHPDEVIRKSPNSVDTDSISSVERLIGQFDSPQRRGRGGPRSRIDPEERRRSRSVDSTRRSDCNRSSGASSPASAVMGMRGETPGGRSAPGSPKARFFSGGDIPTLAHQRGQSRSTTTLLFKGQPEKEPTSPRAVKVLYRVEKTSLSRSKSLTYTNESTSERDTQVTPDLLKGWQELSQQPDENTTKQILFTYLKDGTTDNDSTTQKKVNLVFQKVNTLKWKTAENVEEESKDFAAEVKELQEKRAALEREVSKMKKQLEDEAVSARRVAEVCEKAQADMKDLQEELARRQEELSRLRERLADMEAELHATIQDLVQVKAERDQSRTEMKDLQHQLSEMHDELDQAKTTEAERKKKEVVLEDLAQLRVDFQDILQVQEEQEEVLRWRERELTALKGALKEEVESHDKDMTILKEQCDQEIQQLRTAVEEAKEGSAVMGQEKAEVVEEREAAQEQLRELAQEREQLRGLVQGLESKVDQLSHMIQQSKALESQLEDWTTQLTKEKDQVEETLMEVREKEEKMCQVNQALAIRLEDVQSELTKLNHDHRELKERLKEERNRTEELMRAKGDLQEKTRLQDRTVEQLQRKMSEIVEESEASTERLQVQVDEARGKSFRELTELQRQLQEKGVELEKSRQTAKKLEEELSPLEDDLRRCRRERDEAHERGRQLEQRVEELEERNTSTQEDRARQVKLMEGRICQLQQDLGEERSSADLLMNRVDKDKEQIEQMRGELLQERSVRQDLECDKVTLERQNKDLKSRMTHLEGSQKSTQDGLVSKLTGRIQELEERLQGEERDNNNLQQANRKLERKVKDMRMQVDEEQLSLQSQRDQLTQRLKTAKRQMDEAEEEIERLEHAKKKVQRDLDEQVENNDQLQSQLQALRNEMRRKNKAAPVMMIVEDDVDDVISD